MSGQLYFNGVLQILTHVVSFQSFAVSTNTIIPVSAYDQVYFVTAGAGGVTITLPSSAATGNYKILIIQVDTGGGGVTINCAGLDTIEGNSTKTLAAQYAKLAIIGDSGVIGWYDLGDGAV